MPLLIFFKKYTFRPSPRPTDQVAASLRGLYANFTLYTGVFLRRKNMSIDIFLKLGMM
jgi:hypothetical protein